MPNIDPAKTAKADEIYVKLGAQSLDAVAQNFSGSRYKQNRAKLERQYDGHPIPPWEKVGQAPAPVPPAEPSRASVMRDTEDQDDEQEQEEENDNGKSRRDSMR